MRRFLTVLLILVAAPVALFQWAFPASYRYWLAVAADVEGHTYFSSIVIKLWYRFYSSFLWLVLDLIAAACIALGVSTSSAQTQTTAAAAFATKYFLNAPPTKDDLVNLPPSAHDLVIAKARLPWGAPAYLVRRDESGRPSSIHPKKNKLFRARIDLLDIVSGNAKSGNQLDVFFGAATRRNITPITPAMVAPAYFVVIFLDAEDDHQLLGFAASRDEYDRWHTEFMAYEVMQSRPGSHQ